MSSKKIEKVLEFFVLILVFILPNLGIWLCLSDINNPLSFCSYQNPGSELIFYFLAICTATWLLIRKRLFGLLTTKLKNNIFLIIFILFSTISIYWSVVQIGTIYHLLVMFFVTFLAVFIGTYYSSSSLFSYLFYFCGIIIIASFVLLIFFPHAAIMAEPHLGSWRGVFWHKNFTGSLLALANMIFLLNVITSSKKQIEIIAINAFLYILSLVYTFFSLSAAGVAIWLLLNIAVILLLIFSKIKTFLKRRHYLLIGGIILIFLLIASLNINLIFELLNREPNLTGRIPLWSFLIDSTVSQHPLVGLGFGAAWMQESFRNQVTQSQGWSFQITNGHNGFMDILLNLGSAGLFLVGAIFIISFYRSWKFYSSNGNLKSALPFLIVLYVFLSNLSISFLLELESFHWFLLIIALIHTTKTDS